MLKRQLFALIFAVLLSLFFEVRIDIIQVIAYFVSNFVAVATGVGRGGICLTSFNCPTPKTP